MCENTDLLLADLRCKLRRLGLRLTPQKQAVWRLFATSVRSLSVSEACQALRQEGIGQATVYRVINSLHELGFLHLIHDPGGEHRYLAGPSGHIHHLVCRSCGVTSQVKDCDLSTLEKLLAAQTGFAVEGHRLEFFGLCADCGSTPPHPLA